GLKKGVVVDIDRTVQSVAAAVEAAERLSGLKVRSAFVGISGSHIGSQNSRGMVAVSSRQHDVGREDTIRAIEAARAVSIPNTREILHVIPRGYVVDGQEGVRDPIGMSAVRLEVETHIVTASSTSVQNLSKCVQRAGIEIDELVLAPLATAEALLSDEDRELGVALVDIGGDTTDVAIFQDGSISHCATIPMGARSVTSDLGLVLRVTPDVAESLKLKQGTALPLDVDPDEVIQITSIGEEAPRPITRRHVAQIIEARTAELFDHIAREIEAAGATNRLQAGLALTGGGALLTGVARAARDQLGMSARAGAPATSAIASRGCSGGSCPSRAGARVARARALGRGSRRAPSARTSRAELRAAARPSRPMGIEFAGTTENSMSAPLGEGQRHGTVWRLTHAPPRRYREFRAH